MIPFIIIFGLNTFSIRLPMVIISCFSLIIFYLLLKEFKGKKFAIIGLLVFSLCPWHIMKSRWGLESNIFPDLILLFTYLLVIGLQRKNCFFYYFAFIIAGISCYSYGTSYFFLPIFIFSLLLILILKKAINIKRAFTSLGIITIITLPLIIFVFINTFNLPQINLPFLTIPRLTVNRYEELTAISSNNFFTTCLSNFYTGLKILLTQNDGLNWNSLSLFGTTYLFSIIFFIFGILFTFFKNKILKEQEKINIKYEFIFIAWFLCGILLLFICEPNINRINIIFIPIIYYITLGINFLINSSKYKKINCIIIISLYLFSFSCFTIKYFNQDWDNYFTFEGNLEDVITFTNKKNNKNIYITNKIKEPYIYVLFYLKYSTIDFYNTVEYGNPNVEFRQVTHFGNYYFQDMANIKFSPNSIYIILKQDLDNIYQNLSEFQVKDFGKYFVIET